MVTHVRSRSGYFCLFVVLHAALVCGGETPLCDDQARSLAEDCHRAIEAIRTVKLTAINAIGREGSLPSGAVVTPSGNVAVHEFSAAWERGNGHAMLMGRFFTAENGAGKFTPFQFAYDGKVLKTYGADVNSGGLREAGASLFRFRHIPLLLGHQVIQQPVRDVAELLANVEAKLHLPAGHCGESTTIEVPYLEREGTSDEREMLLRVTVDVGHGSLPSRIQCLWRPAHGYEFESQADEWIPTVEINCTGFLHISEIWVPVHGTYQIFDTGIHVPAGYTFDEVLTMPMKERIAIGAHYISVPFGAPEEIAIHEQGLRVNAELGPRDLTFEYPEGAIVLDDFNKCLLEAGPDGKLYLKELLSDYDAP